MTTTDDMIPVGDATHLDDVVTLQAEPLDWEERIAARLQRARDHVAAHALMVEAHPCLATE